MKTVVLSLALFAAAAASAQEHSCSMHDKHAGVAKRGDEAMGFSHETTTHHFLLQKDGGAIDVSANDAADTATRDEIRMHLRHIAQAFAAGNFDLPMFVHDRVPPGVREMQKRKANISYRFEETERGARVVISTSDRRALRAVHDFLRFQIEDHETGDPKQMSEVRR
jgi:hypothetical protein